MILINQYNPVINDELLDRGRVGSIMFSQLNRTHIFYSPKLSQ